MALRCKICVVGVLCITVWSGASAQDVEMLARLLIPAYLAQDLAVLCGTENPQFLSAELPGATASVSSYAQHVKIEVSVGVPEETAQEVRIVAADTARQIVGQLADRESLRSGNLIRPWCEKAAKPFILEIIAKHQQKHPYFDKLLKDAKR